MARNQVDYLLNLDEDIEEFDFLQPFETAYSPQYKKLKSALIVSSLAFLFTSCLLIQYLVRLLLTYYHSK